MVRTDQKMAKNDTFSPFSSQNRDLQPVKSVVIEQRARARAVGLDYFTKIGIFDDFDTFPRMNEKRLEDDFLDPFLAPTLIR